MNTFKIKTEKIDEEEAYLSVTDADGENPVVKIVSPSSGPVCVVTAQLHRGEVLPDGILAARSDPETTEVTETLEKLGLLERIDAVLSHGPTVFPLFRLNRDLALSYCGS